MKPFFSFCIPIHFQEDLVPLHHQTLFFYVISIVVFNTSLDVLQFLFLLSAGISLSDVLTLLTETSFPFTHIRSDLFIVTSENEGCNKVTKDQYTRTHHNLLLRDSFLFWTRTMWTVYEIWWMVDWEGNRIWNTYIHNR